MTIQEALINATNVNSEDKDIGRDFFKFEQRFIVFYKRSDQIDMTHISFSETHCRDIPSDAKLIIFKKIPFSSAESDRVNNKETIIRLDLFFGSGVDGKSCFTYDPYRFAIGG